jgi:hypothetical protein
MSEQDRAALAAEAFIYGYPLVADLEQVVRYATVGAGVLPRAPFNSFGHGTRLAGPEDTFVSINNDTVYSFAQLDLGAGPQLLQVPEVGGRYYVLQFVDAWTTTSPTSASAPPAARPANSYWWHPAGAARRPPGSRSSTPPPACSPSPAGFWSTARPTSPTWPGCRTAWPCSPCPAIRSRPTRAPARLVTGRCPNPTPRCPRSWVLGAAAHLQPGLPTRCKGVRLVRSGSCCM